jgi:hypothetical protein
LELISITEEPSSMTILNLMGFGNLGWAVPSIHEETLDKKKSPVFCLCFYGVITRPFNIPSNTKNRFHEGGVPMHKCVNILIFHKTLFLTKPKKNFGFNTILFCSRSYESNFLWRISSLLIVFCGANTIQMTMWGWILICATNWYFLQL